MMINFTNAHLLIGVVALVVVLIILWRQNKSFSCLFFFSVFWIYMMGVASVVAFPFPIGYPNPDFKPSVNFIPLNFGDCSHLIFCLRNIYENSLLTMPFGFGISFIARIKPKNIFWLAIAVGFTFELVQLIISFAIRSSFRVVDINDVILNATGVLLGYGIFRMFGSLYSYVTNGLKIRHTYIFMMLFANRNKY